MWVEAGLRPFCARWEVWERATARVGPAAVERCGRRGNAERWSEVRSGASGSAQRGIFGAVRRRWKLWWDTGQGQTQVTVDVAAIALHCVYARHTRGHRGRQSARGGRLPLDRIPRCFQGSLASRHSPGVCRARQAGRLRCSILQPPLAGEGGEVQARVPTFAAASGGPSRPCRPCGAPIIG